MHVHKSTPFWGLWEPWTLLDCTASLARGAGGCNPQLVLHANPSCHCAPAWGEGASVNGASAKARRARGATEAPSQGIFGGSSGTRNIPLLLFPEDDNKDEEEATNAAMTEHPELRSATPELQQTANGQRKVVLFSRLLLGCSGVRACVKGCTPRLAAATSGGQLADLS